MLKKPVSGIEKPPLLENRTILAVDNEPQTLNAVVQLLQSWGATVLSASSLEEIQLLKRQTVDLMLLDYHLDKGHTGIDVARYIRSHWRQDIPGVLNSANRSEDTRLEAAEADLHFLPKPLKPAAFKRLLRQLDF